MSDSEQLFMDEEICEPNRNLKCPLPMKTDFASHLTTRHSMKMGKTTTKQLSTKTMSNGDGKAGKNQNKTILVYTGTGMYWVVRVVEHCKTMSLNEL